MVEAFPLQWPSGKPRAKSRQRSRFKAAMAAARDGLLNEIRLLGGSLPVISTNVALRRDGLPYANQPQPNDSGAAVYFSLRGQQMCFACDRWDRVDDNVQAIRHTIEALRGIERWGTGDMVEQAFTGFIALPAPKSPYEILGVRPGASQADIDAAYRSKALTAHPDRGGSSAAMHELTEARRKLKEQAA